MTRQVIKGRADQIRLESTKPQEKADRYLDRLLKLIPGETVALYLFLQGVLNSGLGDDPRQYAIWLWSIVLIIALGNVLYLRRFHKITDPWQIVILTVAYFIWLFAIGGPFALFSWFKPFMGSVLLGLFTFFIPMVYTGVDVND